jgi:ferrous iron transport protein A
LYPFFIQIPDFYSILQGCLSLCPRKSIRYKQDVITLLEVPVGKRARLISVQGVLRAKLKQYGLHVGDPLRVLRAAPMGGPLLVEVNGREIALGRSVAEKIMVEVECESR